MVVAQVGDPYDFSKEVAGLKRQYPGVFAGVIEYKDSHDTVHRIELEGDYKPPFVYAKPYFYREKAKHKIDKNHLRGIPHQWCVSLRKTVRFVFAWTAVNLTQLQCRIIIL